MPLIQSSTLTQCLRKGDKVLSIAVSSPVNNESDLLKGLKVLEEWGLTFENQVITGRHWGYLAGEDSTRYNELYSSGRPNLVAFAKGGWGSARLLERDQPWENGWLLGYSDLSSLLLARVSAGFDGAIHGPLINSLSEEPAWSKERLKSILFQKQAPDLYGESWSGGIAKGPLIATNLTVGSHLIGTRYMPDLRGAILVLEDINEEPYRIDRMLTQWRLAGLLQSVAGIAFGTFMNCDAEEEEEEDNLTQQFTLKEVLQERTLDLGCPVIGNLPIGHCCGNAALPLGWEAIIDGKAGRLSLHPF